MEKIIISKNLSIIESVSLNLSHKQNDFIMMLLFERDKIKLNKKDNINYYIIYKIYHNNKLSRLEIMLIISKKYGKKRYYLKQFN